MDTAPAANRAPPAAAVRWLQEHGDALYGYALPRVRGEDAAEDLVQETLLAALAGHARFAGAAAERTWLIGILKHKLVDHLRKAVRQRALSEVQADESSEMFDRRGNWNVRVSAWYGDPHAALENAEFRDVLARCLAKLPTRIAQLFWLREADGIGSEQLCQDLEITPTNLWTMLHRARLRLRRCLSIHWFESDGK
jgi:RNA polymerase sigma-70 factor, ECF subfamily